MAWCCCPSWLVGGAVLIFVLYKFFGCKSGANKSKQIQETNWKKDTVYLYQFPRVATLPSMSPFCLKLETFLRVNNIAYENRFTTTSRSKYGLIPFVELNGEHYGDSALISSMLRKHFDIKDTSSPEQEGVSRAIDRFADQHTFMVIYKYKAIDHVHELIAYMLPDFGIPTFLLPLLEPIAAFVLKRKVITRTAAAFGTFSDADFDSLLQQDLEAYRDILGDKNFLFGDKITYADCTVFGQLATTFYLPIESEVKRRLKEDYPTLVNYLDRIRDQVFPNDFERIVS